MKANTGAILTLWIANDQEFWQELRDIEKRLLIDRIAHRKRIKVLAKEYGKTVHQMHLTMSFLMIRVKTLVDEELGKLLSEIEEDIETPDYFKMQYSPN